ncbi:outer membrane beta-barrel protein [Enterobacteriaceae bacterium EKM102V]|uniref:Ail/Lom family outer membrane beta-barrel protein n=1 Tax=Pantoea TaxID=53335 RepID=UPI00142E5F05|nr:MULTISPECIES: Ail/Lom family outer membrane beta-barrel protein [Pantoea]KAF6660594.1 outer membrane beta-barrel protein [Enterobacteriaceae bacterium EKM102V]KAF6669567.1 outer membrane beta-barrel protein [Pantoea sp. EKM103V]
MLLRKASLALLTSTILCTCAMADDTDVTPTMSFGYQRGHINDFGEIQGGNFRFQYETSSPWGFMGTVSAMQKKWREADNECRKNDKQCRENYNAKHRLDRNAVYYSALMGPTYRISDKLSVFALGGISHTKVDNPLSYEDINRMSSSSGSSSSNHFAYSTGLTFDATRHLALTAAFEGSQAAFTSKKHDVKSAIINVGYRF